MRTFTKIMLGLTGLIILNTGFAATSAESEVRETLDSYHAAMKSGDYEALMDTFSADYQNSEGASKDIIAAIFVDPGLLSAFSDLNVDMETAKFTLEGEVMTVKPVIYESPLAPTAIWDYKLKKEDDGKWRLINSEMLN